jgi:hypothetical protein
MTTIAIYPSLNAKKSVNGESAPRNIAQPLRLTPRGRLLARVAIVASLSLLLLSLLSFFSGARAGASPESITERSYIELSVKPGETLWSIAAALNSEGDLRSLIADIVEINRLTQVDLRVGQKIFIPTRQGSVSR